MPRERFRRIIGASDATLDRLDRYHELLLKWGRTINLIGPKTMDRIWDRHFLDSAQFWAHAPEGATSLADIGSGAGFPGLVLAALAADPVIGRAGFQTYLIESDQRKSIFLREAARAMGLGDVTVHAERVERANIPPVDLVTARACAPLSQLLDWTGPMLARGALGLCAKGAQVDDEIAAVTGYRIDRAPSVTDSAGCLLLVRRLDQGEESQNVAA